MRFPNRLMNQLASALREMPRSRPFPLNDWKRLLTQGWAHFSELEDILGAMDGRLFNVQLNDLAEGANYPMRFVQCKPRFATADSLISEMMSTEDVAGFCIFLEHLGFAVDPGPMIESLHQHVAGLKYQTGSQTEIYFYKVLRHKLSLVLRAKDEAIGVWGEQKWRVASGHRIELHTRGSQATMLKIVGPKWRQPRRIEVDCPQCGTRYTKGDPAASLHHRSIHGEAMRLLAPRPVARMRERLQRGPSGERVDAMAPRWMHHEVEQRARRFKRDFGYDFLQWPSITTKAAWSPSWVGFLFADDSGTIDGACAFYNPDGAEWALQWVWIRPERRRHGLLAARWPAFLAEFGDFWIEQPLSPEMARFLEKHASPAQLRVIADRCPNGPIIEQSASVRRIEI